MYNIKDKEQELFTRWAASLHLSEEEFCPNSGLLFRGDFGLNDANEDNLYTWGRAEGNEEEMWCKSPKRLMILTKELNDPHGWDIREESGGRAQLEEKIIRSDEELRYVGNNIYRKMNCWVYGILKEENSTYPPYEDVTDYNKMGRFYESAPLVRINCKFEIGGSSVENKVLVDSMNKHKDLLVEQIQLYQPNIILCCGFQNGENVICNFIQENIYKDLKLVENTDHWVFYSPKYNLIAIDAYHPSVRSYTDQFLYEELLKNFTIAVSDCHMKFDPLIK